MEETCYNWDAMTPREKTEHIVQDVMGWKYFPEWALVHTARWALEGNVTHPYAFWNDQIEGVSVFYQPFEDARPFNPLESMDDAWQVVEKIHLSHRSLRIGATKEELTIADHFLVYLWEMTGKRGIDALFIYTPEILCKAALKAVGIAITEHA